MLMEIVRRLMSGIAWGGIVTFFALSILVIFEINPDVSQIWLYMLGSLIIGMYFGVASLIFEQDGWNPLKKTVIHFLLSIIVYFSIAIPIGWVPVTPFAILLSLIIFILIYILFWFVYQLYYKRMAIALNKTLEKK